MLTQKRLVEANSCAKINGLFPKPFLIIHIYRKKSTESYRLTKDFFSIYTLKYFLIASNASSVITCSTRQAFSSAASGESPITTRA